MPFEVEPVYLKLSYYKPPADPAAAPRCSTCRQPTRCLGRYHHRAGNNPTCLTGTSNTTVKTDCTNS